MKHWIVYRIMERQASIEVGHYYEFSKRIQFLYWTYMEY